MQHLFLDESGNHNLAVNDHEYPVFVLGGIIVATDADTRRIEGGITAAKKRWLGDRRAVLHLADLTRSRRGWEPLSDASIRAAFFCELESQLEALPFKVVACIVDKPAHVARYGAAASDPYILSLGVILERFAFEIGGHDRGRVVVEQRGQPLDREIHTAWRYFTERGTGYLPARVLRERIVGLRLYSKRDDLAGLQIADLVVGAIGRQYLGLRPFFDYRVIEAKLRVGPRGDHVGAGLIVLPRR